MKYPVTPDGRYFVHGTTLWRCTNPKLSASRRAELQKELMNARRQLRKDNIAGMTQEEVKQIRNKVDEAKVGLGERGGIWWEDDGWGDLNRHGVHKGPYREWWEELKGKEKGGKSVKGVKGVKEDVKCEEDGDGAAAPAAAPAKRSSRAVKVEHDDEPPPTKRKLRSDDKK